MYTHDSVSTPLIMNTLLHRASQVEQLDMASNRVVQLFNGVNAASRHTGIPLHSINAVRLSLSTIFVLQLDSMEI